MGYRGQRSWREEWGEEKFLASFFSPGSPVLGSLSPLTVIPTQTSEPARRLCVN